MTHLKITQGNTIADTEELGKEIIQKLYELAVSGDLDENSELQGRIHVTQGYRIPINYLNNLFQGKLFITADDYIIPFEDQNMVTYLNSIGVGSNGIVTEAQAAAATTVANSLNTTVTKFNELKYFTQITESNGGWDTPGQGTVRFCGWNALEEVDLSNFTSIGHKEAFNVNDSFYDCNNLKKVTASNKLTKFGRCAFQNCINLEDITGLSGVITLENAVFNSCNKLKSSSFDNCSIMFLSNSYGEGAFRRCLALTTITLDSNVTKIPIDCFRECQALTDINLNNITVFGNGCFYRCYDLPITASDISPNVTTIGNEAFLELPLLTSFNFGNVSSIGAGAFFGTGLTGSISLSSLTSLGRQAFQQSSVQSVDFTGSTLTELLGLTFRNCASLTSVNLGNITSFKGECFANCRNLVIPAVDLVNTESVEASSFDYCTISGELNLPKLTGTLPNSVFRANRQITKIKCLGKVTSLGSTCFSKHNDPETPALTEVYLPYECTSLGQGCFIDNVNLTTIKQYTQSIDDWTNGEPSTTTNINRITVFGNSCLRGCKSLNLTPQDLIGAISIDSDAFLLTPITGDLVLPNIQTLGSWPFGSRDNGFTSVDFTGSTFTAIEKGLFEKHSSLDHVIFPDTLSTIRGYQHFDQTNPRYIKMPSNTMVTFESGRSVIDMGLSSSTKIYVPDSIVNDYRNNAGWSAKASQIFPMSQFATDFPND